MNFDNSNCKIVFLIYIILSLFYIVNSGCPIIKKVLETPRFSKPMLEYSAMSASGTGFVHCCMFGVSNINWLFKQINSDEFSEILFSNKKYQFKENRRILVVHKPKLKVDSGIYKCVGMKNNTEALFNTTIVIVVQKLSGKDIEIVDKSNINGLIFKPHSKNTIFCLVKIYIGFNCYFKWNKIRNGIKTTILKNSHLSSKRMNNNLINGYSGYSNLSKIARIKQHFIFNLTLTLLDIQPSHEGQYSCLVHEINEKDENIFFLFVESLGNENMYFAGIIIGINIINMIMIYSFQYDLKILWKYYLRFLNKIKIKRGKYNFFFIYDFDDVSEFKRVAKVIQKIENRKYTTYFFHRDQNYGKTTVEEIYENLQNSELIVFWVSSRLWTNPISFFSIQMLLKHFPEKTRLYIMTSKKKSLNQHCKNNIVTTDTSSCMSSNVYFWNLNKSIWNRFTEPWKWHVLTSWLISSLPTAFQIS